MYKKIFTVATTLWLCACATGMNAYKNPALNPARIGPSHTLTIQYQRLNEPVLPTPSNSSAAGIGFFVFGVVGAAAGVALDEMHRNNFNRMVEPLRSTLENIDLEQEFSARVPASLKTVGWTVEASQSSKEPVIAPTASPHLDADDLASIKSDGVLQLLPFIISTTNFDVIRVAVISAYYAKNGTVNVQKDPSGKIISRRVLPSYFDLIVVETPLWGSPTGTPETNIAAQVQQSKAVRAAVDTAITRAVDTVSLSFKYAQGGWPKFQGTTKFANDVKQNFPEKAYWDLPDGMRMYRGTELVLAPAINNEKRRTTIIESRKNRIKDKSMENGGSR